MATNSDGRTAPLRQRTSQRDQALARLSRITTATAVAGTFATVGFGGLAAITYSGTPASDATTLDSGSSDGQQPTGGQQSAGGQSNQVAPAPTFRTLPGTTNQQPVAVNPPTSTRGRSHVRTGGS